MSRQIHVITLPVEFVANDKLNAAPVPHCHSRESGNPAPSNRHIDAPVQVDNTRPCRHFGIHVLNYRKVLWIPAFAGMTGLIECSSIEIHLLSILREMLQQV